jgi:hypothetical protein
MLQQGILIQSENGIEALKERVNLKPPVGCPLEAETAVGGVSIPHSVKHPREDG